MFLRGKLEDESNSTENSQGTGWKEPESLGVSLSHGVIPGTTYLELNDM